MRSWRWWKRLKPGNTACYLVDKAKHVALECITAAFKKMNDSGNEFLSNYNGIALKIQNAKFTTVIVFTSRKCHFSQFKTLPSFLSIIEHQQSFAVRVIRGLKS